MLLEFKDISSAEQSENIPAGLRWQFAEAHGAIFAVVALEESLGGIMSFRWMPLLLTELRSRYGGVFANRARDHFDLDRHNRQHFLL